ncbi:hypothetical protein ACVWYQ_003497 [Bradyrhizobium sp. USDA 3397]
MSERRHEHECLDLRSADLDLDLQLATRMSRTASSQAPPPSAPADKAAARCSVRRLTVTPFSVNRSWRTTSALPRWRMNLSRSQPLKAMEPMRPLGRLKRLHPARSHITLHRVMAAAQLARNPLQPHQHALRRNISATPSGVFITCPRGSLHDEPLVIRSSFICSLLGYPRRGQFLMAPRGQFSMARDSLGRATLIPRVRECGAPRRGRSGKGLAFRRSLSLPRSRVPLLNRSRHSTRTRVPLRFAMLTLSGCRFP